jgi:hypothetical protein
MSPSSSGMKNKPSKKRQSTFNGLHSVILQKMELLWTTNWKEHRWKRTWSDLKYRLKTMKHLSQDSHLYTEVWMWEHPNVKHKSITARNLLLLHSIQVSSRAHPAPYPICTGDPLGVKWWRRCETDHSPPPTAEVKNMCSCTFTPLYVFMVWCFIKHRENYIYFYHKRAWWHI